LYGHCEIILKRSLGAKKLSLIYTILLGQRDVTRIGSVIFAVVKERTAEIFAFMEISLKDLSSFPGDFLISSFGMTNH